jgi:hypothetical protein
MGRYLVSISQGYLTARKGAASEPPGVTACVLDRLDGYRVVWLRRSEDIANSYIGNAERRRLVTEAAHAEAERLNALDNSYLSADAGG